MPTTKPNSFIAWVPDGTSTNLAVPPVAISRTGFQPSQPIPAQWLNYLFRTLDQWNQFLAEGINSTVLATSLDHSMRLIGGGTWAYSASSGVLSWSAPFQLACPSAPDANNQAAAGQVTLPAGSVAFVTANLPFSTVGDVTSGSQTIQNLGYEGGIQVGQMVSGAGIASGTTVTSVDVTAATCNISTAATASGTQESLTFASAGSLTVTAASGSSLVPGPNTVIIARSIGYACSVGVGSTEMWLRDAEARALTSAGYVTTSGYPAGQSLNANQAVYVSSGTADGRTLGSAYLCDASSANQALRSTFAGLVHTTVASGGNARVVSSGFVNGFSGLNRGSAYYLDPTTAGGITSTRPTAVGQALVPIGFAISDSTLFVQPSIGSAISNTFENLIVNGQETIQPRLAGSVLSGTNLAKSATTWSINDTGDGSFNSVTAAQSIVSPIGFRQNYYMGSYSHSTYPGGIVTLTRVMTFQVSGQANTVNSQSVYNVMEQQGSIIALSGTIYAPFTGTIDLYVYQGSILTGDGTQPQSIYIKATVTPYNGHFYVKFPKGQYPFAVGTPLRMRCGSSTTGGNLTLDAFMIVETAA